MINSFTSLSSCDPFDKERYFYSFRNICVEDRETELNDGSISIFLSTKGKNVDEVSDAMVNFLTYVGSYLPDSEKDFGDDFVRRLQETVANIKASREMESKYMTLQEMLRDERREGREEVLAQTKAKLISIIEGIGEVPPKLKQRVESVNETDVLIDWCIVASGSETVKEFEEKIK